MVEENVKDQKLIELLNTMLNAKIINISNDPNQIMEIDVIQSNLLFPLLCLYIYIN